jgi:hypothetical protein
LHQFDLLGLEAFTFVITRIVTIAYGSLQHSQIASRFLVIFDFGLRNAA